jgi:hypothetical protein
MFLTSENQQVITLLRQPHTCADRIRTQLHSNMKFFQNAAQHFNRIFVRADKK